MKKFGKALVAITISAIATFALIEIMLRIMPLEIAEFDSTISYSYSPDIGYAITPGDHRKYAKRCFSAYSSVNSAGFRDRQWDAPTVDAAILGDSFVQASEVGDNQISARIMEDLTGLTIQNVGVQGHGTVSERMMFNRFVAARKPKYVFLFFIDNDVGDNYCPLSARFGGQPATPCVTEKGEIRQPGPSQKTAMTLKAFFKANCATCRALKQVFASGYKGTYEGGLPAYFLNYDPEFVTKDKDVAAAWSTTVNAVADLDRDVRAAGAKLVAVHIPSHIELTDDIKRDFGHRAIDSASFSKLKPSLVRDRLQSNLEALGIESINVKAAMERYRDRFALGAPMFTFSCDKHFNPLGHLVFSAALVTELAQRHPETFPAQGAERARAILQTPPDQLVGAATMDALGKGKPF